MLAFPALFLPGGQILCVTQEELRGPGMAVERTHGKAAMVFGLGVGLGVGPRVALAPSSASGPDLGPPLLPRTDGSSSHAPFAVAAFYILAGCFSSF